MKFSSHGTSSDAPWTRWMDARSLAMGRSRRTIYCPRGMVVFLGACLLQVGVGQHVSIIGHSDPTCSLIMDDNVYPVRIKHVNKIVWPNHYILDVVLEEPCYGEYQSIFHTTTHSKAMYMYDMRHSTTHITRTTCHRPCVRRWGHEMPESFEIVKAWIVGKHEVR